MSRKTLIIIDEIYDRRSYHSVVIFFENKIDTYCLNDFIISLKETTTLMILQCLLA